MTRYGHPSRDLRRRYFGTMPDRKSREWGMAGRSEEIHVISRKRKGGRIHNIPVHRIPDGK